MLKSVSTDKNASIDGLGFKPGRPVKVALIGSSGGGTATLGHTDAGELLRTIHEELQKVDDCNKAHNATDDARRNGLNGAGLSQALFMSLHGGKGFDSAQAATDIATLYSVGLMESQIQIQVVTTGVLSKVNTAAQQMDKELAKLIRTGQIHGLICISCSVDVHAASLIAAAEMKIPVTGSGGTSLCEATSKFNLCLVGNAGGSVATTSYTRAVSFAHSLAVAWNKPYRPFSPNVRKVNPSWRSILNSCLPAFWAVTLACRGIALLKPIMPNAASWLTDHLLPPLQSQALPTVCSVVMATALSPHHGSTVVMAAVVSSIACQKSILGGLLAGWLVASTSDRVLYQCVVWNIPATMTNLVVAGGVGALISIAVAPWVPYLQLMTEFIRWCVHFPMAGTIPGIGFAVGILFCWGSKVGFYHIVCLPVILIEMELGGTSLWGAIDEATLVLVSAGICTANLLVPPSPGHPASEMSALCYRGLRTNLLFGDFIEAAYPFMESSRLINVGGYLASGIATELLCGNSMEVMSIAYLPVPISVLIAEDWAKIMLSYNSAFGASFLFTLFSNRLSVSRNALSDSIERSMASNKLKS